MSEKLNRDLLIRAYSEGYFPMPDQETGEMLWYSPDPRAVLPFDRFHCSRSLMRSIRRNQFTFTLDTAFSRVMESCANREETWINQEIMEAYQDLFRAGICHSVEVWREGSLVGGVYGVHLGSAFFAESMFHTVTDASKAALWHLVGQLKKQGFTLLEVQFLTPHLESLGAIVIPAALYRRKLAEAMRQSKDFK